VDLVEAGVVTGAAKEINTGKIVSAFVLGTPRLYRFIDDNPMVEMRPADYTNDTAVIRRFRKMVAINSAIEVDLTGQVVADSIGRRLYSGVGGQMDFIRGAALAEEGRAIIALPSTAAGGTVSRITPSLQPGAGVVTTRAHVRTVVDRVGRGQAVPGAPWRSGPMPSFRLRIRRSATTSSVRRSRCTWTTDVRNVLVRGAERHSSSRRGRDHYQACPATRSPSAGCAPAMRPAWRRSTLA
jgi:hypothetical protein